MKYILLAALFLLKTAMPEWLTDFEQGRQKAKDDQRLVLLNFSGSDWCGPCIRLKKETFASTAFAETASRSLILVNADFPRNKKNQLSRELQKQNDQLAEKYNPEGHFPFTLLLKADGSVIHRWDGFPSNGTDGFIKELEELCSGNSAKRP